MNGAASRDEEGRFSWSSPPLDAAGTWRAIVYGEGVDEVAEESFEVIETTASIDAWAQVLTVASSAEVEAMIRFRGAMADYPATPGQEEALRQTEETVRALEIA
ncbi:MAG: hypothetical protein MUE60_08575 [Candidatus Eisenbacteria bacterium]|nr:hypothetical protein [Candidatus Eisenbacteria bacterium]